MDKVRVTQDVVYQFITDHNVNISGIAREMLANPTLVAGCFRHNADRHGQPRHFTVTTLPRLNQAIESFASKMRQSMVMFGSDQTYTNNRGVTYDPATLQAIKNLSNYFNLTQFLIRVLGWNETKKNATLSAPSSKAYGCISQDDVNRINTELLAVSGVLSNYEIILDEGSSSAAGSAGESSGD